MTTKIIFLDTDLATALSRAKETHLICIGCALFVQIIDRLSRKSGKKSVLVTMPQIRDEYFPFLEYGCVKRMQQALRKAGIIETKLEYLKKKGSRNIGNHQLRIRINHERIRELLEQKHCKPALKGERPVQTKESRKPSPPVQTNFSNGLFFGIPNCF